MQQVLSVIGALSMRQKVMAAGAIVVMVLALILLSRMVAQPKFSLLYAGLENQAAGEIVQALESRGIAYDIRGGSIFVPDSERDALRLTLASEGLPANSGQGYELLDELSGFGTTSQMFDAAYWRAREGELARTIVSNPQIASAPVHIASTSANPFQRDVTPTASIFVTTNGGVMTPQQARALRYLVASAVPGLVPEKVTVIDGKSGLIGGDTAQEGAQSAEDKSLALRDRVQRLVEARVGAGNAVVEVSVDTVSESESIRERRFDPEGRVVISTDTEERTDSSEDNGGGDVTVASNLPDGDAGQSESSNSRASETRERVNYEISEVMREVTRVPGSVKRLTVAVLVNGTFETADDGSTAFVAIPDEEQEALRALVASAVGFDAERGDEITIRSLPFERPEGLGTGPVEPGIFTGAIDVMRLAQMAVLGLVALLLGFFVVRPILSRPAQLDTSTPRALPAPDAPTGLDGEIDMGDGLPNLPMLADGPDFGGMGMVDFDETQSDDPVERLRDLIEQRKSETVEILRSWLDEKEPSS